MRVFLVAVVALLLAMGLLAADAPQLAWKQHGGYRARDVSPIGSGVTGFTLMKGEQTGASFTNYLSLATAAKNQNLISGSGVAAGDFDNDGWCDLYFCSVEGRNTLFKNLGGWRFEDVTLRAGVACPGMFSTGALFADMNGDGFLDLLVSGNNGPNALFLNQRDGRFTNVTAASGLASKPLGSTSMAAADLDGNGALDLFVANYGENTILRSGGEVNFRMVNGKPVVSGRNARRLKIVDGRLIEFGEPSAAYLNDGQANFRALSWLDGTFRDEDGNPLRELPMDLSLSVMMRDINGDGAPDVYVCNDFQVPDRIWINDGHARFRMLPRLAMRQSSVFSMGVDFADIDRDGFDDFIVCDMLSRFHRLRMTQMTDTNTVAAAIGVIDDRPQIRRNTLFRNRGDGTYAEIADYAGVAASDWTWTPAFIDVDLDGYEDLLVSNGHAYDTQDLDTNEMPGKPAPGIQGAIDRLLKFPKLETPNFAFRNRGDLTFEETGEHWGFNSRQVCHGLVLADLDNDGDQDVVLSSLNAPALLYRNNGAAARVAVRLNGGAGNTKGIGAKIRVLGGRVPLQSQEMIAGGRYLSADEPLRVFAAGSSTNRVVIEVTWRSGQRSALSNVAANCVYEVEENAAAAHSPAVTKDFTPLFKDVSSLLNHRHHEAPFNDFALQPQLLKRLSQAGPGIAWFDLDGDGRDELFIGAGRGGALAGFKFGGGKAVALPNTTLALDDLAGLAGFIFANGSRVLLAAQSSIETATAGALLRYVGGQGTLAIQPVAGPAELAVADIDGDGALELFVGGASKPGRYPAAAPSQLFRQRAGQFVLDVENSRMLENAGIVNAAVWSDLNGDGFPELVLACEWGPPRVFANERGRLRDATQELGISTFTGWWSSVTTADFDGDGRLDIVAGNWGLNSSYAATPVQPVRTFYGDFDGDGRVELVEAELDEVTGAIVPRENLTTLATAMPFLRAKFPNHRSFQSASVRDLLGERFAQAKELTANTLASMLFLNRGDRFEAKQLPREAQLAPVFGMNVADADGDGHLDLFLAENFFATRQEVPRLDAGRGLWLRGHGNGELTSLSAMESGVTVWGEQRGSALGDFDADGRIDLVVSQNGGETKLFRNEGARAGVRVRLKGPPGNPDGIGAVVRLKQGEKSGPAHEIRAGSGYWSQDSATLVLAPGEAGSSLWVRWPGGKVSEMAISAGQREILVELRE